MPISNNVAKAIISTVAKRQGTTSDILTGKSQAKRIVYWRDQAMYVLRRFDLTHSDIAILFSNRSHNAVMDACARVEAQAIERLDYKAEIAEFVEIAGKVAASLDAHRALEAAKPDDLLVQFNKLDAEMKQVESELDRHGAPPAVSPHARIRAMATAQVRALEEVAERAKEEVAKARASAFRKLPAERKSTTRHIPIGPDHDLYVTVGLFEDGTPGEIFLKMAKQGSMLSGLMDAFALAVSLGLKHGVPLEKLCRKFTNLRFEPSGFTGQADMPNVSSPIDAAFQFLRLKFLKPVAEESSVALPALPAKAES